MTRHLWRSMLTVSVILLLALPAFADLDPAVMNAIPSTQAAAPAITSDIPAAPTGVNVVGEGASQPLAGNQGMEIVNPNLQEAMHGEFDQGTVTCTNCVGFEVGQRVVALVNNPAGASGIYAGQKGWVICGNAPPSYPDILVSWDNWTLGHNNIAACDCPYTGTFTNNSGWFVYCNEIAVSNDPISCSCGALYQTGDRVRATVDNPQFASGISRYHMGTVVCGYNLPGLPILISWDNWQSGHNGNGYCYCPDTDLPDYSGWWVECSDIEKTNLGCVCFDQFKTGDRVTATADYPQGASSLYYGQGGTVTCGTTAGFPILLISWDDWQQGHNGNGFCACPVTSLPDYSGWYINCPDVRFSTNVSCTCSAAYDTGDRVQALVNSPQGASGVYAGDHGSVICGSSSYPGWILVSWDAWALGHNGNGLCDCPTDSLPNYSGWWVYCSDVAPVTTTPTDTISVNLDNLPSSGNLPFVSQFTAQLTNLVSTQTRRLAGRISVVLANGNVYGNWRSGYTNVGASATFTKIWNQNFPASPVLLGNNVFTLTGMDVTPSPFNQPPYAASGDTDVDVSTVTGY